MTDLTHDGITQPISEWAADYGIPCKLIRSRLRRGWSVERAITEPMQVWRGEKLKADDLEDKPEAKPAPAPAPPVVPTRPSSPTAHPWCSLTKAPRSKRPSAIAKRIAFNGETLTVHQWAARIGIRPGSLHGRLSAGWPLERALGDGKHEHKRGPLPDLITFNGESLSTREWAARLGVSKNTLEVRFARGWTVPRALTTPFAAPRTGKARRRPAVSQH